MALLGVLPLPKRVPTVFAPQQIARAYIAAERPGGASVPLTGDQIQTIVHWLRAARRTRAPEGEANCPGPNLGSALVLEIRGGGEISIAPVLVCVAFPGDVFGTRLSRRYVWVRSSDGGAVVLKTPPLNLGT